MKRNPTFEQGLRMGVFLSAQQLYGISQKSQDAMTAIAYEACGRKLMQLYDTESLGHLVSEISATVREHGHELARNALRQGCLS